MSFRAQRGIGSIGDSVPIPHFACGSVRNNPCYSAYLISASNSSRLPSAAVKPGSNPSSSILFRSASDANVSSLIIFEPLAVLKNILFQNIAGNNKTRSAEHAADVFFITPMLIVFEVPRTKKEILWCDVRRWFIDVIFRQEPVAY